MEPFTQLTSRVVVLSVDNIDTDQIIPARFLKTTEKTGLGRSLFSEWRYNADGSPKPDFALHRPEAHGAQVLLAGDNFGCGSSREHAPWALTDFGFRVVISTSFADIFSNNSLKNGLLPVIVDAATHKRLLDLGADALAEVTVDLDSQTIRLPDGSTVTFPIDGFSKACLLEGVDQLGYLMLHQTQVTTYEQTHPARVNTLALV
jgi:3-isopropylmalate/(R)-2-methylmalate dehydratase small subunit